MIRRTIASLTFIFVASFICCPPVRGEAVVKDKEVTFRLDAREWNDKPKRVNVAGSFNGWSKDQSALADGDGDLVWEGTFKLEDGKHTYKYVVDGERWINDPTGDAELQEDDGHGGKNDGVIVGPDVRKAPAPQDNNVNAEFIRHDPADVRDANATDDGRLRLRVRAQKDDVKQAVAVIGGKEVPLDFLGVEAGFDQFAGLVPTASQPYTLVLTDGSDSDFVSARGVHEEKPDPITPLDVPAVVSDVPDWAKHAIWYQVFPERFRNGDPSNDPGKMEFETLVPWTSSWWEAQVKAGEKPGDDNFYKNHGNVWRRRYGGDLQGLKWALPYLREAGITAIYLNPVFEAESMHKYDTADFRHIDDNFGTVGDLSALAGETDDPATWQWSPSDRVFLDFLEEAHRQGFKVVIDGVFNHVGRAHPFFMDVLEKGKRSRYADWFEITDWGDEANWKKSDKPFEVHGKPGGIRWKAWDQEDGHLPAFKKDAKLGLARGPREHIMAISKRWLAPDGDPSKGIDGWRLDVANDIPHPFWRDWRKLVKETKPDAYISGEIWSPAQPWINAGDQFDAVMNYQFAMPAQAFFVNEQKQMKPSEFTSRLGQLQMMYPFQNVLVMMNLFDSHDTDRLASMFVNPDRPYDGANRPQDNAADWPYSPEKPSEEQWQRLKQAAVAQYTFVGAPMIYYGTEAGMWSPDDPSNRQPMIWRDLLPYADEQVTFKTDLFEHYQRLAAMRAQLEPLRLGFYVPLVSDDGKNTIAYRRTLGDQHVYVVINRSDREQTIDVPVEAGGTSGPLVNWLDQAQMRLVPPQVEQDPTARPKLVAVGGAGQAVQAGKLTVTLPAYSSAVLAPAP